MRRAEAAAEAEEHAAEGANAPSRLLSPRGSSPLPSIHSPPHVKAPALNNLFSPIRHGQLSPLRAHPGWISPRPLDGEGRSPRSRSFEPSPPPSRSSSVEVRRPSRMYSSPPTQTLDLNLELDGDRSRSSSFEMTPVPPSRSRSVEVRRPPRTHSSPPTQTFDAHLGSHTLAQAAAKQPLFLAAQPAHGLLINDHDLLFTRDGARSRSSTVEPPPRCRLRISPKL